MRIEGCQTTESSDLRRPRRARFAPSGISGHEIQRMPASRDESAVGPGRRVPGSRHRAAGWHAALTRTHAHGTPPLAPRPSHARRPLARRLGWPPLARCMLAAWTLHAQALGRGLRVLDRHMGWRSTRARHPRATAPIVGTSRTFPSPVGPLHRRSCADGPWTRHLRAQGPLCGARTQLAARSRPLLRGPDPNP
jgi:hypothetical protein